jgi:hypothetical protein
VTSDARPLVAIGVVDVDGTGREVRPATSPSSSVVGDDDTNGGLWCSPVATKR